MRYKEIDINIKAVPDKEDEEILNQLSLKYKKVN